MGSDRHFASQQSSGSNVRFGSKADIAAPPANVCFTPKSGHQPTHSIDDALAARVFPTPNSFPSAAGSATAAAVC
jgi:hypothetical protein